MIDVAVQRRLTGLIESLTDKRKGGALEEGSLKQIKAICKQGDDNVLVAFDLLMDRLKLPHAQTRLHVLHLCDELFQRSKAFRSQLAKHFTAFLELTIGYKQGKPLPPPADVATLLRDQTLQVIEGWDENHGRLYSQVSLGCRYLKETLKYQFPELRARAAAAEAEQREREARAQALVQEKYVRLCNEAEDTTTEIESTLTQQEECYAILAGEEGGSAAPRGDATGGAAAGDEEDWEEIPPEQPPEEDDPDAREGLAAYDVDTVPESLVAEAAANARIPLHNVDSSVAEQLVGLHKLVTHRHLPTIQAWLRTLVKVDVGAPGSAEHAARERLLRSAIDLRTRLTEAKTKYESVQDELAAALAWTAPGSAAGPSQPAWRAPKHNWGFSPEQIRQQAQAKASQAAAGQAVAALVSHPAKAGAAPAPQLKSSLPASVKQALLQQAPEVPAGNHLSYWDSESARALVNARGMELQNHWGPVDAHKELPETQLAQFFGVRASYYTPAAAQQNAAAKAPAAAAVTQPTPAVAAAAASAEEEQQLLAPKPVPVTRIGKPTAGQSAGVGQAAAAGSAETATERLPNPVPVTRIGRPAAVPSADVRQAAAASSSARTTTADAPLSSASRAGTNGNVSRSPQQPVAQAPNGAMAASGHPHQAPNRSLPAAAAQQRAADSGALASGARMLHADERTQRAADRAHNDAVLSAVAMTDEELARRLNDQELQALASPPARGRQGKGGTKRKGTVAERLAKKLLTGRAHAAAIAEGMHMETETARNASSNKWENV
ncbi:hypothetical protein WJX72_003694 [[Myrmecia] bisecta]|uniref:VHS domain-containing protein n=1 Tax=[Myrmecia] bisecta TaxID=41462 RepID=A0AAW1PCP4_9CHLO